MPGGKHQARNQFGTPGVAKSFLRGAKIFQTMSKSLQLCPTYFSRWGEKFCRGLSPPWLRAWQTHNRFVRSSDFLL